MGISLDQWRCSIGRFHVTVYTRVGLRRNTADTDKEGDAADTDKAGDYSSDTAGCDRPPFGDKTSSPPQVSESSWYRRLMGKWSITGVTVLIFISLLLLCGDIQPNPGPNNP